ncbi:MAG: Fe-S-containing hydro-lyase [Bacteroidales bacterium]
MKERIKLNTPFGDSDLSALRAGDMLYISGTIYTARDAAHKKMCELLQQGEPLPFNPEGTAVYYAGPAPAKPGKPIGSIGPTTSGRMDLYSPTLIKKGLKVMIGKGIRSKEVIEAIVEAKGVYFAAIGGAAALMAKCVKSAQVIAFEELGPEAVRKLEVEELPVVVAIDSTGRDLYKEAIEKNRQEF